MTIQELTKANVLLDIKKEERREGIKLIDVLYTMTPTMEFTSEIRTANAHQRDQQKTMSQDHKQGNSKHTSKYSPPFR